MTLESSDLIVNIFPNLKYNFQIILIKHKIFQFLSVPNNRSSWFLLEVYNVKVADNG